MIDSTFDSYHRSIALFEPWVQNSVFVNVVVNLTHLSIAMWENMGKVPPLPSIDAHKQQ